MTWRSLAVVPSRLDVTVTSAVNVFHADVSFYYRQWQWRWGGTPPWDGDGVVVSTADKRERSASLHAFRSALRLQFEIVDDDHDWELCPHHHGVDARQRAARSQRSEGARSHLRVLVRRADAMRPPDDCR